jgi:hypothetical protein
MIGRQISKSSRPVSGHGLIGAKSDCMILKLASSFLVGLWLLTLSPMVSAEDDSYYPSQESWAPTNAGSENVSLFIFRDLNGNGRYDLGESPMANVAVNVYRPDGNHLLRRSNLYGEWH